MDSLRHWRLTGNSSITKRYRGVKISNGRVADFSLRTERVRTLYGKESEREYSGSVNCTLTGAALLLILAPIAVCQTSYRPSDCSTLKYARHKVSCLCGTVEVCSGDICGRPSDYELDDDITVELRDGNGRTIGTQKAAIQTSEEQSVWSDRRRCADRGLGCVFIRTRSSEPQAEGSRS
jgi:hypothetical protein